MAWLEVPVASPKAISDLIFKSFLSGTAKMEPMIPVRITAITVQPATPPISSAMPMAIGVVTDFGAALA